MRNMSGIKTFAGVAAIAAAALAPVAASAQYERSSTVERYHLMQVSVASDSMAAEEFSAKTSEIQSCNDAKKLAKALKADVKRNRFISASKLPEGLRDEVRQLEAGKATTVFTADGSMHRVLVLCNRA